MSYSVAALRRHREEKQRAAEPKTLLDTVSLDGPIEDPDAVMHVWAGDRWVPYDKWIASAPVATEEQPDAKPPYPLDAHVFTGVCGPTRVWIVKDGERWLLFTGTRRGKKKQEMATPFLAHAIRTAEERYGAPANGWCADGQLTEVQA